MRRSNVNKKPDTIICSRKPDAILCADLHLRDSVPICRTDDFLEAMKNKFKAILDLARQYNCPVLVAGDFFHRARSSPYLERNVIDWIRDYEYAQIFVIPGQHDLPNHNISEYDKSSLAVLEAAGCVTIKKVCYDTGQAIFGIINIKEIERKIILKHTMIYKEKPIHDNVGGTKAERLLKKFPEADLVLTGDNHQSFVFEKDGRLLVNPGSMMRSSADQIKHRPRVYLYYAEDNTVEKYFLPCEKNVITREHIEKKEQTDEKIQSFVKKIKDDYEVGISFKNNIKSFFEKNKKIKEEVKNLVWEMIENERN
jgi:DNA repair exonuclease SbcCD nuclease subunit